jgi:hypothetical protein
MLEYYLTIAQDFFIPHFSASIIHYRTVCPRYITYTFEEASLNKVKKGTWNTTILTVLEKVIRALNVRGQRTLALLASRLVFSC